MGLKPGWGRSPGEGNPFQYSCLENPMDREACSSPWGSQRVRHDWATFTLEWKQFIYVKTHILHWHTNLCIDFWFFILAVLKSLRVQMWMRHFIYSSYLQKTSEYRSQKRAFTSINELILVSLFIVSYFYLTYLDQLPICTTPIVNTGNI